MMLYKFNFDIGEINKDYGMSAADFSKFMRPINFYNQTLWQQISNSKKTEYPSNQHDNDGDKNKQKKSKAGGGETGGDKGFIPTPTLINNSLNTIWFKPECNMIIDGKKYSTWGAYPLKPREKWYHPIGGFNTDGRVIKVYARNLYLPITVYGIEVYGGVLFGKEVNGSWLNEQMFDKNWEWNKVPGKNEGWENDTKWHNIFYPNNQWHNSYY